MKTKIITAVVIVLFASLAIYSYTTQESKLHIQQVELKSRETKLKALDIRFNKLNTELDKLKADKNASDEQVKQLEEQRQQLEEEKQQLQADLQAKLEAKSKLAQASQSVVNTITQTKTASASAITGDKHTWLAQSGIPQSEWQYVDYIVSKESGWQPCAYYPSQNNCGATPTTACGLAQSLPCGKQSVYGHWTDPVANLKWMNDYVKKYGGWAGAYSFWTANRWY